MHLYSTIFYWKLYINEIEKIDTTIKYNKKSVRNLSEKNVDTNDNSPRQGLSIVKDLILMLSKERYSPDHRSD